MREEKKTVDWTAPSLAGKPTVSKHDFVAAYEMPYEDVLDVCNEWLAKSGVEVLCCVGLCPRSRPAHWPGDQHGDANNAVARGNAVGGAHAWHVWHA